MAQAVGGAYGLPHGAMNAICLPPAMRFNAPVVPDAMTAVPVERVEELARLAAASSDCATSACPRPTSTTSARGPPRGPARRRIRGR